MQREPLDPLYYVTISKELALDQRVQVECDHRENPAVDYQRIVPEFSNPKIKICSTK